jgi:integrase
MANFTQRGKRWQAHVRLKDPRTGVLHKVSKAFDRKIQDPNNPDAPYAEAWASEIQWQIRNSRYRPETEAPILQIGKNANGAQKWLPSTLNDLINKYIYDVLAKAGPDKHKSKNGDINRLRIVSGNIGSYLIVDITNTALAEYRDIRLSTKSLRTGRKLGPQTVKHELSLLSRVFNAAIKEWGLNLPNGNPVEKINMPSLAGRERDRRLVGDEQDRLFAACAKSKNPYLLPVVEFAIESGMRASEILEVTEKDVIDGIRRIKSTGLLFRAVQLNRKCAVLDKTKNGDKNVSVPLSAEARQIIRDMPPPQPDPDDVQVFPTTYDAIHRAFVKACKVAEIKDLRFHDLRHEATSRLAERGLDVLEIQKITRHKDLKMLLRYVQLVAEDVANAVDSKPHPKYGRVGVL